VRHPAFSSLDSWRIVQGDVAYDVEELLSEPKGKDLPILKGVPSDNMDIVEDKKKKGGDGA
jgi:hypothetical protein